MKQEELPKEIYIPKAGVDAFGAQTWHRELPDGVRYVREDLVEKMVKEARSDGFWKGYGEAEAGEDM